MNQSATDLLPVLAWDANRSRSIDVPRPGRQRRSRDAGRRIVEATRVLLKRRSFHELTLDEIGAASRTSRSSLYARFPSKASLLECLQVDFAARISRITHEATRRAADLGVPLRDTMRAWLQLYIAVHREYDGEIRAFGEARRSGRAFARRCSALEVQVVYRGCELVRERAGHPLTGGDVEAGIRLCLLAAREHARTPPENAEASWNDDTLADELSRLLVHRASTVHRPTRR